MDYIYDDDLYILYINKYININEDYAALNINHL